MMTSCNGARDARMTPGADSARLGVGSDTMAADAQMCQFCATRGNRPAGRPRQAGLAVRDSARPCSASRSS
jgi:hypothetical protein